MLLLHHTKTTSRCDRGVWCTAAHGKRSLFSQHTLFTKAERTLGLTFLHVSIQTLIHLQTDHVKKNPSSLL